MVVVHWTLACFPKGEYIRVIWHKNEVLFWSCIDSFKEFMVVGKFRVCSWRAIQFTLHLIIHTWPNYLSSYDIACMWNPFFLNNTNELIYNQGQNPSLQNLLGIDRRLQTRGVLHSWSSGGHGDSWGCTLTGTERKVCMKSTVAARRRLGAAHEVC